MNEACAQISSFVHLHCTFKQHDLKHHQLVHLIILHFEACAHTSSFIFLECEKCSTDDTHTHTHTHTKSHALKNESLRSSNSRTTHLIVCLATLNVWWITWDRQCLNGRVKYHVFLLSVQESKENSVNRKGHRGNNIVIDKKKR